MAMDPKLLRERASKALQADYFSILGVPRSAGPEHVEKAYLDAAKVLHPDRGPEELRPLLTKVFARLDLARSTLLDPARRAAYLAELTRPASADQVAAAEAALEHKKGEALLKRNDPAAALGHLKRAVTLAPTNGEYRALLAWAKARPDSSTEQLRELVMELGQVIAKEPELEKAYFYRAQLRRRLGLAAEAVADFTRAAELNPKNIDAAREVRLHKMRASTSVPPREESAGGFFKKLFKR